MGLFYLDPPRQPRFRFAQNSLKLPPWELESNIYYDVRNTKAWIIKYMTFLPKSATKVKTFLVLKTQKLTHFSVRGGCGVYRRPPQMRKITCGFLFSKNGFFWENKDQFCCLNEELIAWGADRRMNFNHVHFKAGFLLPSSRGNSPYPPLPLSLLVRTCIGNVL